LHCACNHLDTPTYAHNEIISYPYTRTSLHVSVINHHLQADANKEEYILLILQFCMYNNKNI
jgi:hypothetical protein